MTGPVAFVAITLGALAVWAVTVALVLWLQPPGPPVDACAAETSRLAREEAITLSPRTIRAAAIEEAAVALDAFLREPLWSSGTPPMPAAPWPSVRRTISDGLAADVESAPAPQMTLSDQFRSRALARVRALKEKP